MALLGHPDYTEKAAYRAKIFVSCLEALRALLHPGALALQWSLRAGKHHCWMEAAADGPAAWTQSQLLVWLFPLQGGPQSLV